MAKPSKNNSKSIELLSLGKEIRESRKLLGFSQEDFAHEAGLDRSYLGGIERGEHNLTLINLIKIAKALSVTVSVLLEKAKI